MAWSGSQGRGKGREKGEKKWKGWSSKEGERKDGRMGGGGWEEGRGRQGKKNMQVMPDWSLMPDNASLPPLSTSPPGRQLWQCISRLGQTVSGDIHNGDLVQMVP